MENELSFKIEIGHIKAAGNVYNLNADIDQLGKLAGRFSLKKLHSLSAELKVTADGKRDFIVEGTFAAKVRHTCGVTLGDFDQDIAGGFTRLFTTDKVDGKDEISPDEEIPDQITDGTIDLGEVVAEELALALPVFPKKPGVSFKYKADDGGDGDNPFEILGRSIK